MKIKNKLIFTLLVLPVLSFSQNTTAFNFLSVNTNAQSAGFGEIGVVSSAQYYPANSIQNPAIISQNTQNTGINFTYNSLNSYKEPKNYCVDMFYSLDSSNTFGLIYNHFKYGEFNFTTVDLPDNEIGSLKLYELYAGLYYSHTFIHKITLGLKFKYGKSHVLWEVGAISFDLGASYVDEFALAPLIHLRLNLGASIVNMGPKIEYPGFLFYENNQFFQPTALNAGIITGFKFLADDKSSFNVDLGYQYSKLLASLNTDDPIFNSYINSFSDAKSEQGDFLKPKQQVGFETRYNIKQKGLIAFRAGYYNLSKQNNSPRYQTWGGRIGLFGFFLDYANIKYSGEDNDNSWLINVGFNLNMASKFRFVD